MRKYNELTDTQVVLTYLANLCCSAESIQTASESDPTYLFNRVASKYVDFAKQSPSLDCLGSAFTAEEINELRTVLKHHNGGRFNNKHNQAIMHIFGYSANI